MQLCKIGHFFYAGRAPRRPNIYHRYLIVFEQILRNSFVVKRACRKRRQTALNAPVLRNRIAPRKRRKHENILFKILQFVDYALHVGFFRIRKIHVRIIRIIAEPIGDAARFGDFFAHRVSFFYVFK